MDLNLHSGAGSLQVSDAVFGAEHKPSLIHQVVTAYMAGARAGTKAQKNRSAVNGGGAKPWRQKGTGASQLRSEGESQDVPRRTALDPLRTGSR